MAESFRQALNIQFKSLYASVPRLQLRNVCIISQYVLCRQINLPSSIEAKYVELQIEIQNLKTAEEQNKVLLMFVIVASCIR